MIKWGKNKIKKKKLLGQKGRYNWNLMNTNKQDKKKQKKKNKTEEKDKEFYSLKQLLYRRLLMLHFSFQQENHVKPSCGNFRTLLDKTLLDNDNH